MNQILTSPVTKLSSLFKIVEEKGIDRLDFLKRAGLESSILDSPDNRLSLGQIQRLNQEALKITKDEYLGLHQGEQFVAFSTILGYVMMTCETLLQALEKFIQYQRICDKLTIVKLKRFANEVSLQVTIMDAGYEDDLHMSDYRLSGIYTYLQHMTGVSFDLSNVWFRHPAPRRLEEYERIFKAPVTFNRPVNALNFNDKYLKLPLPGPNRELLKKFEQYAGQVLEKMEDKNSYADKVRRLVATLLKGDTPSINSVAGKLAMSVRNLQLKLKQENTSYSKILTEVRKELAMGYLHDKAATVEEIAYLLGYSEVSVFYRAFKKWTNATPVGFRRDYM